MVLNLVVIINISIFKNLSSIDFQINIVKVWVKLNIIFLYFQDIMKARNLEIPSLPESEIPDFTTEDKLSIGLLLYRDTLNYLEYLAQVFQKFYESDSA